MSTAVGRPARLAQPAGETWALPGGRGVRLRPLTAADAGAEQAFFRGLSLDSRHKRFHVGLRELSPALLALLTDVDQRLHRAWVAESLQPGRPVVADARYVRDAHAPERAEFAVAVADDWQGLGLGRRLIAHLAAHARQQGVQALYGDVLAEHRRMLALMRDQGARLTPHPDGPQLVRAVLDLAPAPSSIMPACDDSSSAAACCWPPYWR
ncbi:MAG: GNAT family N-acetyltransferase [Comamonadaceae bacterium]|nr:GNAT family N-acetyltransferase [Comamonadaceae bacterium]